MCKFLMEKRVSILLICNRSTSTGIAQFKFELKKPLLCYVCVCYMLRNNQKLPMVFT